MASASAKAFIGILLTILLATSFLGVAKTDMAMVSDGQMALGNCFMHGMTEALCQMNPLEHIAAWQSMFTAVPNQNNALMLLLALLALVLGALFLRSHRSRGTSKVLVSQSSFTYYKRHVPIISSLQEAFSSGILHPKLY